MKREKSVGGQFILRFGMLCCFASTMLSPLFSQSRIPAEANNYIQTTGNTANGDQDPYMVVFYEVPDTITSTLYFAINHPGIDTTTPAAPNNPDQGTAGPSWTYYLVGGTGTLSSPTSRQLTFANLGEATTGTILDTRSYTNENGWNYFAGVSPSQGEHIGNKYYFKIIAVASNGDRNGFQLDASYSNSGIPTGDSSIRAFAYCWTLALLQRTGDTWDLYPFMPDSATGNIDYRNWDMDSGETLAAWNKSGNALGAPAVSPNGAAWPTNIATTSYPIGSETNGTWRLEITETSGGEPPVNTSMFWFENPSGTILRTYAAPYTPPAPSYVTISPSSATVITGTNQSFTLQIVDSGGNPVPYVRNIYVTVGGSAAISPNNNGSAADELIATNGDGLATFTVTDAVAEPVTVTFYWDGTGGSDNFGSASSGTATVTFQANLPPAISSFSNLSYYSNQAAPINLPTLTITDSGNPDITAANDIRIRFPTGLSAEFLTTITTPTLTVAGAGGGAVSGTVSYPDSKTLLIDVTTDFAVTNTLTIGGATPLQINSATDSPSSGRLEMSVDGGSTWSSVDDKLITILDPNPTYTWSGNTDTSWTSGSNWVGGVAPSLNDGTENIIIPGGRLNYPVLPAVDWSINQLTIDAGASLSIGANNLTINGTFSNNGTLIISGAGRPNKNDTDSGTVRYTAAGGAITDFGGTDYYNLEIDGAGTFTTSAALTIAQNLSVVNVAGILDLQANPLSVSGTVFNNGTIRLEGSQSITLASGNDVDSGTWVYNGGAGGTIADFGAIDYFNVTVNGTGTFSASADLAVAGTLSLNSGTLAAAASPVSVAGNFIRTAGSFTSTGTLTFNGAGAQAFDPTGSTFTNITVNKSGGTVTLGASLSLSGNLTVSAGELATGGQTVSMGAFSQGGGTLTAGASAITVGGNWTRTAGAFDQGTSAVTFTGTSALTSGGGIFYDLTIGAGATVTPQDALTVNRNFVINNTGTYVNNGQSLTLGGVGGVAGNLTDSNVVKQNLGAVTVSTAVKTMTTAIQATSLSIASTLNTGGNNLSVTGDLTVTGTLNLGGAGTLTVGGNVTLGTLTNGPGSTLELNGGLTQVVRPNGQTLGVISVSGVGTVVRWSQVSTVQNVTVGAGAVLRLDSTVVPGAVTLNVMAGSTVTNNGAFELNASSGILTLQGTAASANYAGTDISWSGQDLTIGNLIYAPTANLPNLTDITLNAGATFTGGIAAAIGSSVGVGVNTLSLGAASTFNGSLTVGANGAVTAGANALTNGGTITFSGGASAINCGAFTSTGTITNTGTNTITASGNVAISGTFGGTATLSTIVMSGATTNIATTTQIGHLTLTPTAAVTVTVSQLKLAGGLDVQAGATLTDAPNDLGMVIAGAATVGGAVTSDGGAVSIGGALSGAGSWTAGAGALTIGGDFTLADLTASSTTTSIAGATVTFTTLDHNSGELVLNGNSVAQALTTNGQIFNNLTINSSGTVTANDAVTVVGNVNRNAGNVVLGGNALTVAGDISYTAGTISSAGTITLNGTSGAQDVNLTNGTIQNLVVNNTSGSPTVSLTNTAAFTWNGDLTITAGTLVLANLSQTIGGNVSGAGTLDGSAISGVNTLTVGGYLGTNGSPLGTLLAPTGSSVSVGTNYNVTNFTHNNGTVIFTGTGTIYSANTFNNLTINSSGTVTANANVVQFGDLYIQNGILDLNGNGWLQNSLGGSATSDTFTGETGTLTLEAGAELRCGTFVSQSGHTVQNSGTNLITASGDVSITGAFNNPGNSTIVMTGTGKTLIAVPQIGSLHIGTGTTGTASGPSATMALGANLSMAGDMEINDEGSLDAAGFDITISGTYWLNRVGAWSPDDQAEPLALNSTRFEPQNGTVTISPAGTDFAIYGNNRWYKLSCSNQGLTIRFEEGKIQRFLSGGEFTVQGVSGNKIILTRTTPFGGTEPGDYQSADLDWVPTVTPEPDKDKMWRIDMLPPSTLTMAYVSIKYSDARLHPLGVPDTVELFITTPNNLPPNEIGATCFKWIDGILVVNSYTEDSNGNGKIDRLRITAETALNYDFSGFDITVEGYDIDRTKGVKGFEQNTTGVAPYVGSEFFVWLVEKPYLDTDATPRWRITTNTSLKDQSTGKYKLGQIDPYSFDTASDTAPPRIGYTLSLIGSNDTFIHFSEPVYSNKSGGSFAVSSITGANSLTAVSSAAGGTKEALASFSSQRTLADIVGAAPLQLQYVWDKALPPHDYSTDPEWTSIGRPLPPPYNAYGYEGQHNPGTNWTNDWPNPIASDSFPTANDNTNPTAQHRISDILISVPPANASDNRYFVWPLWARDSITTEVPEDQYESAFPTGSEAASQTVGLVRDFTGTQWLRDQDITLQVRVNPALSPSPANLSLLFDSSVANTFRASAANGPVGLWLPVFNQGSPSGAAFSGIVPWPNDPAHGGGTSLRAGNSAGDPLWNFSIPASDPRVRSVSTLDFFFTLDNGANSDDPLYVARLDVAPGSPIPADWYRRVRPFSFDIHDITKQRSNATILNNVIDPTKGERVRLSYQLTKPGQVTIQVFTLDGDLVQVLYRGYRQAGDYTASWDGKNRGGRVVARGMYFIRIVGPEIDEIRKVMVVKE